MKLKLPISHFPRQFDPAIQEMMDRPDPDPLLLRNDLDEIERINRYFGAHRLIRQELDLFVSKQNFPSKPCAILDFCTGSGDMPRVIVDRCRERNIPVQITATDINPFMLKKAKEESTEYPEIQFQPADLLNPPFDDGSFDWVVCNLALHHFSAEQAVLALRQMWRITRSAILVNDLHRSRVLSFLTKNLVPLISSNPMTRFDAYLSSRRAFTWDEMLRLAFQAGIPSPRIRHYFFGRQSLTAWKDGSIVGSKP